jgi:hypothetical protein
MWLVLLNKSEDDKEKEIKKDDPSYNAGGLFPG